MIISYRVVTATSLEELEDEVNGLIKYNWQPYGDVQDNEYHWVQALVLHENGDKAE